MSYGSSIHVSRVLMRILIPVGRGLLLWVGYRWSNTATSGSLAPRSHRHKPTLSPVALTCTLRGAQPAKLADADQVQRQVRPAAQKKEWGSVCYFFVGHSLFCSPCVSPIDSRPTCSPIPSSNEIVL